VSHDRKAFGQALLRGRYMVAAGTVENNGTPIDVALLRRLDRHWDRIKRGLIKAVDHDFAVYDNGRFVEARFATYLTKHNIPWPRLPSGRLCLDEDTFRQQAKVHPIIAPLQELRSSLGQLRLNKLSVGADGRNRVMLSAFSAKTGRNQPSTNKFIFGPATWVRYLIKPGSGRAIAYVDWSAQEIAVAAALSGETALWDAYSSGDPYIAFARQAGMVPLDATKASHPQERAACKTILLGINYGMSAEGLAERSGIHVVTARDLLRRHREIYRVFWKWAEANVDMALLGGKLETVFGWSIQFPPGSRVDVNARSMLNWPMQANGAEMMRLAVAMAIEDGLMICAPIHDALLLEAPIDEIDAHVARLVQIMGDASELVMGEGKRCRSEAKIVRYPDRFEEDARGGVMFRTVMGLLEEAEQEASAEDVGGEGETA
jgi:DNA polymerase-1